MLNVVWWEVETAEPERFMSFHSQLRGWSFSRAFEDSELEADYWVIQVGSSGVGGLQRTASAHEPLAGTRVYFEVDDLERYLEKAESLGGRVERARTELGGSDRWFATFTDPCGVSFGVWTGSRRDVPVTG